MAIRWIGIYAGFVFTFAECEAARSLILVEVRVRMDVLTAPGCPHARSRTNHPLELPHADN